MAVVDHPAQNFLKNWKWTSVAPSPHDFRKLVKDEFHHALIRVRAGSYRGYEAGSLKLACCTSQSLPYDTK